VTLWSVNDSGRPASRIAQLNDRGVNGDGKSSDGVYSVRVRLPNPDPTGGFNLFRVTAAFRGVLLRVDSHLASVEYNPNAGPVASRPKDDGTSLKFIDALGAVVFERPLRSQVVEPVVIAGSPALQETTESAMLSPYQMKALIHVRRSISTAVVGESSGEPSESDDLPTELQMFGESGLLWKRTSKNGLQFLVSNGMLSGTGDRTLLVECADPCTPPSVTVLDSQGKDLIRWTPTLSSVQEIRITRSGRYVGLVGTVSSETSSHDRFVVLDTNTRKSWLFDFNGITQPAGIEETDTELLSLVNSAGTVLTVLPPK
jgi:hypothetical protein